MLSCKNCGAQMSGVDLVCKKCGTPWGKKHKSRKKIYFSILAILLVACAAYVYFTPDIDKAPILEIYNKYFAAKDNNETEKNNENGRKLLQVYQYLKNANVDIKDIRKIIEFLYENTQYLNAQCIITQHKACVSKAKTDEGLFDYEKYFLKGLEIRYKNQFLENIETTDQFNKVFGIKELPKIPMHNWLNGE